MHRRSSAQRRRAVRSRCVRVATGLLLAAGVVLTPTQASAEDLTWTPWTMTTHGRVEVARWNPCGKPITYHATYGAAQVRDGHTARQDLRWAIRQVEQASGLRFRQVRKRKYPAVTIRWWSYPDGPATEKAHTWVAATPRRVFAQIKVGEIDVRPSMDDYRRPLLLHELGHLIGLGHVNDPNEIMWPYIGTGTQTYYQAGDLAGLWAQGAGGGCIR